MGKLIKPAGYKPLLDTRQTEQGIKLIKEFFQQNLSTELRLRRVTAPLFVLRGLGINDDLNGVERAVAFPIRDMGGAVAEVVHSLAKWKRLSLAEYGIEPGYGIYTDMNAIRADEELDNLHSLYVDQWDWEAVITPEQRTVAHLRSVVERIYAAVRRTEYLACETYPQLKPFLPERITFVHSEELLRNSLSYGPGEIPPNWRHEKNAPERRRLMCRFSPASFMLSLEELLLGENVDIWYDTLVCGVELSGRRVSALIVENESGRGRIAVKSAVDASGTAVVFRRAGIPCLSADNYLTMWAIQYQADAAGGDFGDRITLSAVTTSSLDQETHLTASPELLERMYGKHSEAEYHDLITYRGMTGKSVSRFVRESHRIFLELCKTKYEQGKYGRKELYPLKLPLMPQFRKIYCVEGEYVLQSGENAKYFEDSVGLLADWRKAGPEYVWEVPFRTLYPKEKIGGVIAAGRCTAAQGDAWEITRVIPSAAMTGQVAGLAASMAVDAGKEVWELDVHQVQDRLRELGFPIHRGDAGI